MKVIFEEKDEEMIYRKVQKRYRVEDARRQVSDLIENGDEDNIPILSAFDDSDYETLADRFLSKYDCDIDENSQWRNLILDYIN